MPHERDGSPTGMWPGTGRGRRRFGGASSLAGLTLTVTVTVVGSASVPAVASPPVAGSGASVVTTGSTSAATPGLTANTITIGQVDTLSGPVPGLFEGAEKGTAAYVAYVNGLGGVDGRKLVLDTDDDQFSASNYATDTGQLVDSTFALVGGFSLFDGSTGAIDAINAARIPDVTFSLTAARALDPYNYSPDPLVVGGSRLGPFLYYKKKYPTAIGHVATLYNTAAASAVTQTEADLHAMASLGYKLSFIEQIGALQSDFTAEVLKMKQSGTQMVYIVGASVGQVADLAKDMAEQDFKPQVFSTNGVAYDATYIPLAGAAANGTYTDTTTALYLGQDAKVVPAVGLFDKWMKKTGGSKFEDTYAVFGWASAELFAQALKAAGPDPTRPAVLAALNKITSFDAGGLLAPGNPAQKKPETCWIMAQVVGGKWQRTAPDKKTGYVCSPGGYYYPPGTTPFVRPAGA